jgi:hypothetical protein
MRGRGRFIGLRGRVGNGTAADPFADIKAKLLSYWKFDEATAATRADSKGDNDLTDHNSVTQVAGKLNNAAGFNGSTQWLSCADDASLDFSGTTMTTAGWVKFGATGSRAYLTSKHSGADGDGWILDYDGTANLRFFFPGLAIVTLAFVPTLDTWYWVCAWYDGVNLSLSVNNGSPATAAYSSSMVPNAADFQCGGFGGGGLLQGDLDGWLLSAQALTADDRAAIYNGGSGTDLGFP